MLTDLWSDLHSDGVLADSAATGGAHCQQHLVCRKLALEPGAMAGSIEEFSYELSAAALAEQERALNALRTRAGTIVAAASISGSFLAAKVSHGSLDTWAIFGLITFVMCLGCAIWVLLPHSLVFAFRGEALLGISDQRGVEEVAEAYRAAGIWIEPYLDANSEKIGQLSTWFTASCVLLAVEVIFWTISLTG